MEYIKQRLAALTGYMRARIGERSTWGFWLGGVTAVAAFPYPVSVFFALTLLAAGFLPDGTVLPKR